MSLFFAFGFLLFAILGFSAANDASKYHKEYVGIAINSGVGCMSVIVVLFCLGIFVFVELPLYGIILWQVFK